MAGVTTALTALAAKPALAGMIIGGLANKKDPIQGAVLGALGGSALKPALAQFAKPAIETAARTVAKGDTLTKIAADSGTTVGNLVKANPTITDPNLIKVGQKIKIPKASAAQNTLLSKLDSVVKDKPLESAQLASSALGMGRNDAPLVAAAQPLNFGGGQGFGNVPSVEEAIASTADSPRFIPKGLFEEGKQMLRDEEELMMLQQQLQARGLT